MIVYNPVSPWVQFINDKRLALYSLSVLPLRLSSLTEDTSKIAVSSCGVNLQEVLSGLDRTLDIHVHFCGFSQHFLTLFYFSVHLGCITSPASVLMGSYK